MKQKQQKKPSHSFYKEAQKSWNEYDGKIHWAKIKKTTWKIIKWSLGLYLAVAALWGCVQGFIITTSPSVGKGLEVYSSHDTVVPNFYQVENNYQYQVSTDASQSGSDESNGLVNKNGLAPMPFLVENPDYGKIIGWSEEENDSYVNDENALTIPGRDINGDEQINEVDKAIHDTYLSTAYVKPASYHFLASSNAMSSISYQVSIYDPVFLSNYLIRVMDDVDDSGSYEDNVTNADGASTPAKDAGKFLATTSSVGQLTYDFDDDEEGAVPAWRVYDRTTGEINYVKKTSSDEGVTTNEEGKLINDSSVMVIPEDWQSITSDQWLYAPETINWVEVPVASLQEETYDNEFSLVAAQAIYAMNIYEFINEDPTLGDQHTTTTDSIKLDDPETDAVEQTTLTDLIDQKIIEANNAGETEAAAQLEAVKSYNPYLEVTNFDPSDYQNLKPDDPSFVPTLTPAAGVSLMVMPMTSGSSAITPSASAMEDANTARTMDGTAWQDGAGYGSDPKTANAGWILLDDDNTDNGVNDLDTYTLYADEQGALYGDNNNDGLDDGKLVAQQKTYGKGEYGEISELGQKSLETPVGSDAELSKDQLILEEKIKTLSQNGAYAELDDIVLTVDEKTYNVAPSYQEFLGISSMAETGFMAGQNGSVTPNNQVGASVDTANVEYNEESSYSDTETTDESALDESAIDSGQNDYDNFERYSMVTWAEAWAWGGPYYGTFVYPLSQLSLAIQSILPYQVMGAWSVILGVFIIIMLLRSIGALMSFKKKNSQNKMQELQPQIANIKAKYADHKTNKQMKQRMQMEIQALYRKHEVNPFQSMSSMLITMPIFLALWTIISAIPIYKIAAIGAFSFAVNPMYGMFNTGMVGFIYFLFVVIVIMTQVISSKLPNWLADKRRGIKNIDEATKAQLKKQNRTQTIMLVVFVILGLTIPTLLGLYWVFSGLFTIGQTCIQHWLALRKEQKKQLAK